MPKFAITERKRGRAAVTLFVVNLVVVVGLFTVLPWMRGSFGAAGAVAIAVAIALCVMGYAVIFSIRWQRGLDEVELAGSGFAAMWGTLTGQLLFALALMLPPFHALAVNVVEQFAAGPGVVVNPRVVILAMVFAFASVGLLQAIATIVLSAIWGISKR